MASHSTIWLDMVQLHYLVEEEKECHILLQILEI